MLRSVNRYDVRCQLDVIRSGFLLLFGRSGCAVSPSDEMEPSRVTPTGLTGVGACMPLPHPVEGSHPGVWPTRSISSGMVTSHPASRVSRGFCGGFSYLPVPSTLHLAYPKVPVAASRICPLLVSARSFIVRRVT